MTDQTALAVQQTTNLPTHSSAPALSSKLSELLLSGDSPVVGPKTAGELQAYLDAPQPDWELPTPDRVQNLVSRMSLATAKSRISPEEAKETLDLYWRALKDIPIQHLGLAFDDLLKTATFMPKPAEIRAAALKYTARFDYLRSRARHLVWKHQMEYVAPPADPMPPEEVAALLASVKVGDA